MSVLDTADTIRARYEGAAPQLDPEGFRLFRAAGEITGIRNLWEEFPYEDACGRFEEANGHELCVTSPPPISGPSPGRSCLGPPMSGPFCGRWIPPPKNTRRLHGSSMPKRWSVWVWKNQHSKKKKERK